MHSLYPEIIKNIENVIGQIFDIKTIATER